MIRKKQQKKKSKPLNESEKPKPSTKNAGSKIKKTVDKVKNSDAVHKGAIGAAIGAAVGTAMGVASHYTDKYWEKRAAKKKTSPKKK